MTTAPGDLIFYSAPHLNSPPNQKAILRREAPQNDAWVDCCLRISAEKVQMFNVQSATELLPRTWNLEL